MIVPESYDLVVIGKRIETLFAATQNGQVDAWTAWHETAGLLIPIFNELRKARADGEKKEG